MKSSSAKLSNSTKTLIIFLILTIFMIVIFKLLINSESTITNHSTTTTTKNPELNCECENLKGEFRILNGSAVKSGILPWVC